MSDLPDKEEVPLFHDFACLERQKVILAYKQGRLLTRAEWEANIASVVTVNADNSNDFGWMEHVEGPYVVETTATMLPPGRYGIVRLGAAIKGAENE